jgi:cytochrome c
MNTIQRQFLIIGIFNSVLWLHPTAQASTALALDKGCYACHGAHRRGDAPPFDRLASKLERLKGDATAEKNFIEKYSKGKIFERVDAHQRISAESAARLIHWLVEGGK